MSKRFNVHIFKIMRTAIKLGIRTYVTYANCQTLNYQFLIQGKIQSYHWSKEYCKLYSLVVYFLGPMIAANMIHCFISDDTTIIQIFYIKFK